jgi:hypothetical protein
MRVSGKREKRPRERKIRNRRKKYKSSREGAKNGTKLIKNEERNEYRGGQ